MLARVFGTSGALFERNTEQRIFEAVAHAGLGPQLLVKPSHHFSHYVVNVHDAMHNKLFLSNCSYLASNLILARHIILSNGETSPQIDDLPRSLCKALEVGAHPEQSHPLPLPIC